MSARLFSALSVLLVTACSTAAAASAADLRTHASVRVRDLVATLAVEKADAIALERINRDFATAHRLRDVRLSYRDPDKLRMESPVGLLVYNGATRYFRIPRLKLQRKETAIPPAQRRRWAFDLGLLTPSDVESAQIAFVRSEGLAGAPADVFDVKWATEDGARHRVWVDQRTHLIAQREWYAGDGTLRAVFRYQAPREVQPGVWLATRIEICSADGALAGVVSYADLKVNEGLPDTTFETP